MKKIILLLAISIVYSCAFFDDNGIDFTVKNASDGPISNLSFSTSEFIEKKTYKLLENDQHHSGFLSMKDNKSDGSYIVTFSRANGIRESINFGYYSNGICLNEWIAIDIKTDTVLTSFGQSKSY
nr:hypothetical protein [uncultured Psychroserpens sp.]